ncbi:hypothetical protein BaRGS_00007773 [Batillaria attramentaria]|uniref:Uncharacterized protein n=1 Tax=Batillaria attramentaria TaxID=370345 RepID=A0ABD0LNU1_9CAEN
MSGTERASALLTSTPEELPGHPDKRVCSYLPGARLADTKPPATQKQRKVISLMKGHLPVMERAEYKRQERNVLQKLPEEAQGNRKLT